MFRASSALVVVALSTLGSPAAAQVELDWLRQIDTASSLDDDAFRIVIAPDGTIVSLVRTLYDPSLPTRILKHAADGTLLWSTTWTISGDRVKIADIALEPATGDVYAVGTSRLYFAPTAPWVASDNIVVARFDASGVQLWERSWDGPDQGPDFGAKIVVRAGQVVVAGNTPIHIGLQTVWPLVALAYDQSGTSLWSRIVTATYAETYFSIGAVAFAPDGDLRVAGAGAGLGQNPNIYVTCLAPGGSERWTRAFDGPGQQDDVPYAMAIDAASNVYVAGRASKAPAGSGYEGALVKWSAAGVLQWSRTGDAIATDAYELNDVELDVRGDLVACGTSFDPLLMRNALLVKTSPDGQPIWERSWAGDGDRTDTYADLALDAWGGVVAGGRTVRQHISTPIDSDALIVRYDAAGAERWVHRGPFSFTNIDTAACVAFAAPGEVVYAGGTSNVPGGPADALFVRLAEQGVPFCFGDGTSTACPCANASAVGDGTGCRNSLGLGAKLVDLGDASLFTETLTLRASGTPNGPVLYYEGSITANGGAGTAFGDGLMCVAGQVLRLGTIVATSGSAVCPAPGAPPISVRGAVQHGHTYYYQARYRNAAQFCTSETFNQTNGISIAWTL